MGSKTYKTRALVLRKTKLGEKDMIVTMLDESGMLRRGVAKGARKPGGSLAARLEVFSLVDALMAEGRSLDVVCEVRFADRVPEAIGIEQAACAAPVAELLCLVAQPDLAQPRLFELSRAAFERIASSDPGRSALMAAASLWKIMGQSGFRPSFSRCALCGNAVSLADDGPRAVLSIGDGGIVCGGCARPADAVLVAPSIIKWCDALIGSTFDEVASFPCDAPTAFSVLHLSRAWIRAHTGRDLKSLDFLFTSGLF